MKPSAFYERVVDVMEELVKFTWLVRDRSAYLVDRYSERVGRGDAHALATAATAVEAPSMPAPAPRPRARVAGCCA